MAEAEFRNVARVEEIPPGTVRAVQVGDEALQAFRLGTDDRADGGAEDGADVERKE